MKGVARMTRQEFIVTLREGIRKLPPEEIVAATEFYEEYFDEVLEAGEKTEEEIVSELGNPKRIASQIKAEYAARLLDGDESLLGEKPTTKKKLSAAWWVVIGIVSAPVSIPVAICAVLVLFGAACAAVGIAAGIIGGFHLLEISPQVEKTANYLRLQHPGLLCPCHCTCFHARATIHNTIPIKELCVGDILEIC